MENDFQHKPEKKLTYREKVLAGKVTQFGRGPRKPMARKKPMPRPKKKISQVSKKQRGRLKTYNEIKKVLRPLPAYQLCWRCDSRKEIDMHHPMGRHGEWMFVFEPICQECHDWIHTINPNQAYEDGWIQKEYRRKI